MNIDLAFMFNAVMTLFIGALVYDKKQDKAKVKELDQELNALKETVARQDERQKMLMDVVNEMKRDIKDIKHILMGDYHVVNGD